MIVVSFITPSSPGCLCVGPDGPLGPDGLHGNGSLCRLHSIRETSQSEGLHPPPVRPPSLRRVLGLFLPGKQSVPGLDLLNPFIWLIKIYATTPLYYIALLPTNPTVTPRSNCGCLVRLQCQRDGEGGHQTGGEPHGNYIKEVVTR